MQRLLQSIRLGISPPGSRLPSERDLAEMLKVSRDTVRDALGTLVEQGYVISRRGRYGGTFVCEVLPNRGLEQETVHALSEEEIDDLAVLRRVIEVGAAQLAASRELKASERAELVEELRASSEASATDYRRLDARLHLLIAELTGSGTLLRIAADLRTRVNAAFDEIPLLTPNLTNSNIQHKQIVDAILSGNSDLAAKEMLKHVEGSDALLQGYLASTTKD